MAQKGSDSDKVRRFFEDIDHTIGLNQLSYTPEAPSYMNVQYRVLASAMRRAVKRWTNGGGLLLDVGCGHGELIRPLCALYQVYGVDLSFGLLLAAKSRGLLACQSNGTTLPFSNAQFDAVVCSEVLQHIPDPQPLLTELARVCRPEGALILSTLNRRSLLRAIFDLFSRPSRLASLDLPIIKRTSQAVSDASSQCGWTLRDGCWVLSPSPFIIYGKMPAPLRERFATNYILYFVRESSSRCLNKLSDEVA